MLTYRRTPAPALVDALGALLAALLIAAGGAMFAYSFAIRHDYALAATLAAATVAAFKLLTSVAYDRLDAAVAVIRENRRTAGAARVAVQVADTRQLRVVRPAVA